MLKRLFICFSLLCFAPAFAQFQGNALDFDGNDDMVVSNTVPALFSNLATNSFTFEAWVNPRGSLFTRIFFAQPSTTDFATVSTSTGNVIYFYVIANGTTYSVATSAGIPQNQWTHVAARWDATTLTPQVLFNGVLQATGAGGGSSTGTNGLMTLGARPGGSQYFNGALDEARLWSEYRSDCQILANMNKNITGVQTNMVFNYDFNQGIAAGNNTTITTLNDNSGNGYNGTLTNFTLTAATSNWIASGATVTTTGNSFNNFTRAQSMSICYGGDLTFPDGSSQTNITAPFIQNSTITGPVCDTVVSTTVSVNAPISRNDTSAICSGGSFTFADGSTQTNITAVVDYTSTLQTATGCDSLVITHIGVLQPTSASEIGAVCPGGNYTFPDGTTLFGITSQVVYVSTIQNVAGCDSTVTTTVSVNSTYSMSNAYTVCTGSAFTFADGSTQNNITSTVTYTSTLSTINGCDSAITTTISVDQPDTSVTVVNETLTANLAGATYQWLDCANGYAILPGAINQSYMATVNGTYAVSVTMNGCTDTSNCFLILSTGLNSVQENAVQLYPNPTHDILHIATGADAGTIELLDLTGKIIDSKTFTGASVTLDMSAFDNGVYFVNITTGKGKTVARVIKN
ncbi:hypothetical protein BH11BAC7_BH11BAC7_33270 [soil metagenome]